MKIMLRYCAVLLFLTAFTINSHAQTRASINGYITDIATGETLISANIILKGTQIGGRTNTSGFYNIVGIQPGTYTIQFSYIGFDLIEQEVTLEAGQNIRIDVALTEQSLSLEEVIVDAEAEEREEARSIGTAQVSTALIKQVPAVLQADVFRSVQLLPGVKAASDFSSGLYI